MVARTEAATITRGDDAQAITLVVVPCDHPSRSNIVPSPGRPGSRGLVSHPIETSHETTPGTFCPSTPNAARLSTMVGAEPRLPARAITPQIAKRR